jgi:hypothetical protein
VSELELELLRGTGVHTIHFRSILLASALVVFGNASAFAQSTAVATGSAEFEFVEGYPGAACMAAAPDDNIVWGTLYFGLDGGAPCAGTALSDENIIWGTALIDDNIVWGTMLLDDNIVWGTALVDDNIVWGTARSDDEGASDSSPSLEF